MTELSIETRNLTKRFGTFTAVDSLNLAFSGAQCVGFLGPNGAGKTTTLKLLTDMIFPTAGETFLNGVSVQKDRKRALSSAGVLIETPEVYPSLTPREAFQMIGGLRGMSPSEVKARTDEVLGEVKMSDWADQKVGRFSKGMKQRINIASALLHDPEILLLDEPSTGLDPRGVVEVRDVIRGLKRSNRLIFMSSHILSEVVDVCDIVALIDRGKLIFSDSLAKVTARFGGDSTMIEMGFAAPINDDVVATRIANQPGVLSWERLDPRRLNLRVKGDNDVRARLLEQTAGLRLGLVSFHDSRNTLEEIYLSQVSRGD